MDRQDMGKFTRMDIALIYNIRMQKFFKHPFTELLLQQKRCRRTVTVCGSLKCSRSKRSIPAVDRQNRHITYLQFKQREARLPC